MAKDQVLQDVWNGLKRIGEIVETTVVRDERDDFVAEEMTLEILAIIRTCQRRMVPPASTYPAFINDDNCRILDTDNFGNDYPGESFHLWPMPKNRAERIVAILNETIGPNSQRIYQVVPYDYKLQPGFEP